MVFLDHVPNLHIHSEKTHKDSGAHCMNMLILYMVQKTHTAPYYRVQALFMCCVVVLNDFLIRITQTGSLKMNLTSQISYRVFSSYDI